jgi:pyruvate dehydrogenase (quinone)
MKCLPWSYPYPLVLADIKMKPSMKGALSGTLLSMGGAMPYAIAGKFSHPDRPAVAW